MVWYKCDRCGHETFSDEDITGEDCIAGSEFIADPALQKVRDDELQRLKKEEPKLVCDPDRETKIKKHGCIPFGFPFYRVPGKYYRMDDP